MFTDIFKKIFVEITKELKFNTLESIDKYEFNKSGDKIKSIDKLCEKVFINNLQNNNLGIIGYISEETENLTFLNTKQGSNDKYIVAFDPLDGSNNFSSNISTGSIYAIYKYNSENNTLINIIESGYCLYGVNSVMVYTEKGKTFMDILSGWDNFIRFGQIHFDLIKDKKKIYSINESKDYDPEIRFLLQQYKKNHYNMRWVGTLVADAHRILINDGIFYYPNSEKNPNGKIRILYESIPLAFIFKNAGGVCLNGSFNNMLERISNYNLNYPHLKTSIVLASKTEYENMRSLLNLYEENKF